LAFEICVAYQTFAARKSVHELYAQCNDKLGMKNGTKGGISTGFFFQLNSHNPDNEQTSAITSGNSNKQTCHAVNQKGVPA